MKLNINIKTSILALTAIVLVSIIGVAQDQLSIPETKEEALLLINIPNPEFNPNLNPAPMDAKAIADLGFEQQYENSNRKFAMRDGKELFAFTYARESNTTVILLHGVLSGAYMMNKTAGLIREATNSEVIAIDLRGHGQSEGTPGDVDYIDQYADDLSDVISAVRKEKPNQRIILAGHSMGGGIVLRYAMKKDASTVDGYLLLAPHLGKNAPTIREEEPAEGEAEFLKIHIERIIGLEMLNTNGETDYNHLPVLFFNLPAEIPLRNYSYRANESISPEDYKKGLNAIHKPLLVVVGSLDEAFDAGKFKAAIIENSTGEVYVIEMRHIME